MRIIPIASVVATTDDGPLSLIAGDEVDVPAKVGKHLVDAGLATEVEKAKPAPRAKKVDAAPENKKV